MNQRPPKLRKHATGQYMVRWGGHDHYLGHDYAEAQRAYLDQLAQWADWRGQRNRRRLPPMRSALTVARALELFLAQRETEGGLDVRRYYEKHLSRFGRSYGPLRLELVRSVHVQALKDDMLRAGYAARTINHDITAIRGLVAWASGMEYIAPVSLAGCRKLPLGPAPDKSLHWGEVVQMMRDAGERLRPWLALNYCCLMRPSEVITVVHRRGQWTEHGVYRIPSKTDRRSPVRRHVVLSESALIWLELAEPIWSRLDSYSQAVRAACAYGPGRLRHTAATHLSRAGVDRASIDLLLGHSPGRVSATYAPTNYTALRELAGRIAL